MSVPAAYLAVVLIWSTTPLAVKWSGEGPGFLLGALGRMGLAALLCLALVAVLRMELPWHRRARQTYLSGALGAFGAMLCVYWAAQYVPSGLIAVLFGLSPLVTTLLARPLLGERAFTPARLAGLALGLAGLMVIFGAGLNLGPHAAAGLVGLCAAVMLHSLSLVLVKRYGAELPSFTVTSGALVVVTPLFFATWLALDGHAPPQLPPRALASIVYLGIIGSVVGFTLFFYVVKKVPAHTSALITLITPILALLLGTAINHEHVGPRIWAGTALVLGGLAMHQWGGWFGRLIPARVAASPDLPPGP
jgi:drug/metabolite transporter (DMT)-like permease